MAAVNGTTLFASIEPVAAGNDHPQDGRWLAQFRWQEETVTAFGDTPPQALLALGCKLNLEAWPGDTATRRALDPDRRVWPAPPGT